MVIRLYHVDALAIFERHLLRGSRTYLQLADVYTAEPHLVYNDYITLFILNEVWLWHKGVRMSAQDKIYARCILCQPHVAFGVCTIVISDVCECDDELALLLVAKCVCHRLCSGNKLLELDSAAISRCYQTCETDAKAKNTDA